jgi:hypothetical protein
MSDAALDLAAQLTTDEAPCRGTVTVATSESLAEHCRDDTLLGYATIVPSSTHVLERWHDLPAVHELGALEVVRSARRRGSPRRCCWS